MERAFKNSLIQIICMRFFVSFLALLYFMNEISVAHFAIGSNGGRGGNIEFVVSLLFALTPWLNIAGERDLGSSIT